MSDILRAFENDKAFIPFLTAGDPDLETTKKLILTMQDAGADLIEVGIPFSDPVAEGVVIQKADERALAAGTTTDGVFAMIEEIKDQVKIPMVFMTYANVIFAYGADRFAARTKELGMSGVIIPDVPFEESKEAAETFAKYDLDVVSMIAPTSKERIKEIATGARGFVYCVSSMGVTGVRAQINKNVAEMAKEVKKVKDIPCAVGFGISKPEQAEEMSKSFDGVIVGSAIVSLIEQYGKDSIKPVYDYVKSMKEACVS